MRRQIVYPGQVPLETDLLNTNRNVMIALGKLAGAVLGTGGLVNGLAVTPTQPASLSVQMGAGEIYQLENIDNTAYSSLAADTMDTCVKQGIQLQPVTIAIAPPSTAGYSQCYLIEATYQEVDGNNIVLPYFNSGNINQAFNGPPSNPGEQQATQRDGQVFLQAKAGIAAATGSQVAPALDPGYIALAVVTVANGQATITATNIQAVTTGVLPTNVLQLMQQGTMNYAIDTGAANAYVANLAPQPAALPPGMFISLGSIKATNTGQSTLAVPTAAGIVTLPIQGAGGAVLQGGELIAGGGALLCVNATASALHLVWTNGATPLGHGSYGSTPAQFDSSTKLVTTAFLKAAGAQFSNTIQLSANTVLGANHIGALLVVTQNAGPITLTLPPTANQPIGSQIAILNQNIYSVTVQSGDAGSIAAGAAPWASISIAACDSAILSTLTANANSNWELVSGSALNAFSSTFGSSLMANGYKKIPDPSSPTGYIILQWGVVGLTSTATMATANFPTTFPNGCLNMVSSDTGNTTWTTGVSPASNSQYTVWCNPHSSNTGTLVAKNAQATIRWLAFGY
ncbi:hypothetical protein EO087_00310 [Dyella sp. M7H15-1]|uniref:gp53-like domain-containing protein n=1 Tax=Dyella sp. M7H15-1 TaxID=2501295 RepID=UPI0010050B5D|nr:hypothetical protein [Dyella sp. M7H15-1]QAU22608.1 hypothetical protein EO087_00310 [Dyella sp. M7H15-1]